MNSLHRDPFHSNPSNWVCAFIYYCKEDPRIVVPKRLRGFGWTLNFANVLALPFLTLLVACALLPFKMLTYLQVQSPAAYFSTQAVVVAAVIWLCVRLSLPPKR